MNAQEIRDLFQKNGLDISREDVWEVRPGTPVVLHKALERLAAAIGVQWEDPQVIRSERDEAVVLVRGYIKGRPAEWSIGEACIGQNYKVSGKMAAYPYAMAEKRGKDRVILKLAGLHGVYSEEEADDFKQDPKGEYVEGPPHKPDPMEGYHPPTKDSRSVYVENSLKLIEQIQTPEAVSAWLDREVEKGVWKQHGISEHHDDGKAILMACKKRRLELKEAA
jgi:hypothetical protein